MVQSLFSSCFSIMMQSRDPNKINSSNQGSWKLSVECSIISFLLFIDMDMEFFQFTQQHNAWLMTSTAMQNVDECFYSWIQTCSI